jgi:hypothetical protein
MQTNLVNAVRLWLADETPMPVPETHKRILRQRLADFKAGCIKTTSHDELGSEQSRPAAPARPHERFFRARCRPQRELR